MPYRLTYFKEAKNDISEAKIWYHSQQKGLEKRFAEDIKKAVVRLKLNPYAHTIRYKKNRVAHPDVFPYSIHFYVDEAYKRIVIIGIVHNSRDFNFLKNRD